MKIGIIGITGRMGTILSDMIEQVESLTLSGGISSKSTDKDIEDVVKSSEVLVDFSTPSATLQCIEIASEHRIPFVSGTTGFSNENFEKIKKFSQKIPILLSANFSIGVQLMAILLQKCTKVLSDFDLSIIDKHHNRKKDSPSGTALFLEKQANKKAQIVSIRSGNIVGDHICDFIGEDEMLTISHSAFNKNVFASGALNSAVWLKGKTQGLYSSIDYLHEKIEI